MSHADERNPHRRRTPSGASRAPSWASGDHPEAVDGPFVIERLTALSHDLSNLLDGSMRCLGLARRSMGRDLAATDGVHMDEVRRHVDTVYGALERMAELVHTAMQGSAALVVTKAGPGRSITMEDAVGHAARVMAPEALELKTRIDVSLASEVAALPAGPLYTVVLNALRNAMESIARVPESMRRDGGAIRVIGVIRPAPASGKRVVVLEVLDDGAGVRRGRRGKPGRRSRRAGHGVGLALAREVVTELGGTVELSERPDIADRVRPGAVLRIIYPLPRGGRGRRPA